jgi:Zn-dependent membrane protease YugP
MTPSILLISLVFMALGMIVQYRLKSKFKEYGKVPVSSGLSGKEIAEKMLRDNGIYDVQVISANGFLSDHYDPFKENG